MKLVMTLMARDEVDVIASMVEHHVAQGVDLIIATDNGSVDGTREILARYAEKGVVELHDDPRHEKQQSPTVTAMARRAYEVHGATWVLNADADEYWVAQDRSLTLREAFEQIPTDLVSFDVPVVNMTGTPARQGCGVARLTWRDERPAETLMEVAGLHAQPTQNAVHVGSADVEVAQGNHFVNLKSHGQPPAEAMVEVLHLPWRSLEQHRGKVEATGRAYEASPTLRPSPNHRGMRDYRRLLAGRLEDFYLYRHPADPAADPGLVEDTVLVDELSKLAGGDALIPELLAGMFDVSADQPYSAEEIEASATAARIVLPMERLHVETAERAREDLRKAVASRKQVSQDRTELRAELARTRRELARTTRELRLERETLRETRQDLARVRSSRVYRVGSALTRPLAGLRGRKPEKS